jgi:hypothetical protein
MKVHPIAYASRITAHEAGHIIVAWYCRTVVEIKADLSVIGDYRTYVRGTHVVNEVKHPGAVGVLATWEHAAFELGGLAAETVILGGDTDISGSAKDIVAAITAAKRLRAWKAAGHCPWHTLDESVGIDFADAFGVSLGMRERLVLRNAFAYARYLVAKSPGETAELRRILLDRRRLDWAEIQRILGPRPWAISHRP